MSLSSKSLTRGDNTKEEERRTSGRCLLGHASNARGGGGKVPQRMPGAMQVTRGEEKTTRLGGYPGASMEQPAQGDLLWRGFVGT